MGKAITNDTRQIVKENKQLTIILSKCKDLMERAVEEIENCYGRDTELTLNMHEVLEELDHVS